MAQRDYVSRRNGSRQKKKSSGMNKILLVVIGGLIILGFMMGLFWLKQKAPEAKQNTNSVETPLKSVLPSRPEEVWSYIQDLETREIPIDSSPSTLEKNAQLTAEQKRILAMLEQDQQKAQKAKASESVKSEENSPIATSTQHTNRGTNVVETKSETTKPIASQQPTLKVNTETKVINNSIENKKSFGLQCGAFKNKQQAENLQARLAMAGFNSRVSSSADWNRVFIGPVGDRNAANDAQARAKSITNCVVINM
ncbi:cell division protein FtsN [Volucribacter psittacicida]|uniref:Cell division protein FtsN n=1 Tax=Volucribacter psittacicida TaxID=203482 RepID=A0A4R1FWM0_9PAST|nr:cell division protein FtsN [Volucribacter psittacicida]TCJ98640.1 cell division protein FtsN [Volucribacter psittacicida]